MYFKNIKMLQIILILILSSQYTASFELQDNFLFCQDLNKTLNFSSDCANSQRSLVTDLKFFECETRKQILRLHLFNENSYFKYENSVYHVINRSIRMTTCSDVKKIEIHEQVEKCTKDILVSFFLTQNLLTDT
jgi:hypothetical protein